MVLQGQRSHIPVECRELGVAQHLRAGGIMQVCASQVTK